MTRDFDFDRDWAGLVARFGGADGLAQSARQTKAFMRRREIANAVDLPGHPGVVRRPANELQPDSDLGARLVTRDVAALTESEIENALEAGADCARRLLGAGLIEGAALQLQGEAMLVGAGEVRSPTHSDRRLEQFVQA